MAERTFNPLPGSPASAGEPALFRAPIEDDPFGDSHLLPVLSPRPGDEVDSDGHVRPPHLPESFWAKLPDSTRYIFSQGYLRDRVKAEARAARSAASRPAAPRYTTDYAITWGRRQGWRLVDRERYDHRLRRHHDLEFGADVIFRDSKDVAIFVQGAGRGERAEHRRRFEARGGAAKLAARYPGGRFVYVEFERGSTAPVRCEEWGDE